MNMTRNYILTRARWNKLRELVGLPPDNTSPLMRHVELVGDPPDNNAFPLIRDLVQVRFNGKLMRTWHGDCIKFKTEAEHTWFLLLTT